MNHRAQASRLRTRFRVGMGSRFISTHDMQTQVIGLIRPDTHRRFDDGRCLDCVLLLTEKQTLDLLEQRTFAIALWLPGGLTLRRGGLFRALFTLFALLLLLLNSTLRFQSGENVGNALRPGGFRARLRGWRRRIP